MDISLEKPKRGASWQLVALLGVSFIPLLAAYIVYFTGWGLPKTTVNKGYLLSPALDFKTLKHHPSILAEPGSEHSWKIVIPVSKNCDLACNQNLYVTRQVHIRLGEKADRIQRFAVNLDGDDGDRYLQNLKAEHPKLKLLQATELDWQNWIRQGLLPINYSDDDVYLLMDPFGFAMMMYSSDIHGNDLLKDIKRVLRYSPE